MSDFFTRLFDPSGFVPRRACGDWTPGLVRLHNASDALIWLAYLAIPLVLLVIARRRKDVPFRGVYFLFVAFILTCGFTHFLDVVMFYSPLYRLSGLVKAMTAVASWATVVALVTVLPKALAVRGPEELEREIAERRRVEAGLRQSEEHFRLLVEGVRDYAIFMLDPQGRVLTWNAGAERIKGYRAEEIAGQHFSRFYPQDAIDRGWPMHELEVARTEGRFEDEGWRVRKDGTRLWANVVITAMHDEAGRFVGYSKITRDLTARKRADETALRLAEEAAGRRVAEENARLVQEQREQLWTSREQLRLVTDHAPVMLVHCDTERRYKFVNRAYAETNGLSPRDVVGKTIPEVVGEPAYALLRANVDAALAGQRVEFEVASPYEGAERRWLHYTYLPHRSDAGSVQGFLAVILDVTDRRKAEELLRSITDTVPALIAYVDTEGRYRLNNWAYEQWFGQSRSGMAGRHMRDVLGESAWAVIGPRIEAAVAGQTIRYEALVPYQPGGMRWVDATYTPHLGTGGAIDGVVVLVNDITERRGAETALRQSEGLFRQLANAMPQIVWTATPDGSTDYFNERWFEYTGLPRGHVEDEGWKPVLHPDDLPSTTDAWHAAVRSGRRYEIEHRFRNGATGEYRWHMARAVPVRDDAGGIVRWFGTSTDIHDKKLAEEELRGLNATLEHRVAQRTAEVEQRAKELRDQTRLLESIVNSVAEGVVVADENAKFLLFNPAAERMLGVGATDSPVAGWSRTYGVFLSDGQTEFPPEELPLARAIRGEPMDDVEMVIRHPKQHMGIFLSVTGRPLHSDDRRGCGGVVVFYDITARKRAEEQTAASLREKEVLLKEIHHRVKNNLQVVSSLLNLQSGHTTDPAAREMFKESRGRVRSMALIHERLYRSQDMDRVDLAEYVRQLAEDLHRTYRASDGVRLELDVDVPPLAIDVAIPCGLLLNELISNCFKHAFADAAEGCLRVSLRRDGGANVLTVADDGAGFPASTDFRDTTSFGLQLVNTMVDQLDGEIALTGGRGTTFTVRFPKPGSSSAGTLP